MLHVNVAQDAKSKDYSLNGIPWFFISTWDLSVFLKILLTYKAPMLAYLFKLIAFFHSLSSDLRRASVSENLLCVTIASRPDFFISVEG